MQKTHSEIERDLVRDPGLHQGQYGSFTRQLCSLWAYSSGDTTSSRTQMDGALVCGFLLQCNKVPPRCCLKAAAMNCLARTVGQEFRQGLGVWYTSGLLRLSPGAWLEADQLTDPLRLLRRELSATVVGPRLLIFCWLLASCHLLTLEETFRPLLHGPVHVSLRHVVFFKPAGAPEQVCWHNPVTYHST